jgi:ankyrin repeat protein
MHALNKSDYKLLQKCIDHGLSLNKIIDEESGNSKKVKIKLAILHEVVKGGDLKLLEVLISTELEINPVNKNCETPLIMAIERENIKMAKFLIDIGADLKKRNNADMSPLMLCCQKSLKELVHYLVMNKAEINEKSLSGVSPLSLCKDEDLSLFLIQSGARLSARPGSSCLKK